MGSENHRLCVCGDCECEHEDALGACVFCRCRLFRLDAQATASTAEMHAILRELPDFDCANVADPEADE